MLQTVFPCFELGSPCLFRLGSGTIVREKGKSITEIMQKIKIKSSIKNEGVNK